MTRSVPMMKKAAATAAAAAASLDQARPGQAEQQQQAEPLDAAANKQEEVDQRRTLLETLLIDYRWLFVCVFLLPASFAYNLFFALRNALVFWLNSAPQAHDQKVRNIQKQVLEWKRSGGQRKMCTGRPGWQTMSFRRPLYKRTMYPIHCNLIDILHVDTGRRVVRCEPLANMGQISRTLAQLGWTLAIVPELDDLTVGGLVMGTGVESSSHRHGLFQHICTAYELVLADGSAVRCTESDNPDLFAAVPWSYGTLGLLTAVEMRIVPATKYIRMRYEPIRGLDNMVERFRAATLDKSHDFVEALQFGLDEGVLMTARMVPDADVEPARINDISRWHKPWFFVHVRNMLKDLKTKSKTNEDQAQLPERYEFVPLREYYHRHSRSLFWELQDIVPFGNNVLFRWLFGWMMPVKVSLLKITQADAVKRLYERHHIIQDFLVPTSTMARCLREFDRTCAVYPVWLCPFRLPHGPGMVHPSAEVTDPDGDMYVDIGVYGVPQRPDFDARRTHRELEDLVVDCAGFQMLYADTYRTRTEFRRMFDHRLYDRVRSELACSDAFPEVYDKVSKAVRD